MASIVLRFLPGDDILATGGRVSANGTDGAAMMAELQKRHPDVQFLGNDPRFSSVIDGPNGTQVQLRHVQYQGDLSPEILAQRRAMGLDPRTGLKGETVDMLPTFGRQAPEGVLGGPVNGKRILVTSDSHLPVAGQLPDGTISVNTGSMGSKARANTGSAVATGKLGMGPQPTQFNARVTLPSTGVRISSDGTASHFAINPNTGRLQKFDPSKFANAKTSSVEDFYRNLQEKINAEAAGQ